MSLTTSNQNSKILLHTFMGVAALAPGLSTFAAENPQKDDTKCNASYYVTTNFSGSMFGKSVQSVTAHAGVLEQESATEGGTSRDYWNAVTDQNMSRAGDHFFSKFRLAGFASETSGTSVKNLGPVVQYFVTFTDGTSVVNPEVAQIPVDTFYGGSAHPPSELDAAVAAWTAQTDAKQTTAFEFHAGTGCPQ